MSNPYDQNPEPNPYGQNPSDPNQPAGAPYGQNPYAGGYPAGGYGAAGPQPHPQGTTVLVLGIVGLVICGIAGVIALVMGNRVLKEIDANPGAYNNRQNVVIGRVLGIVATILWGIGVIISIISIIFAVMAGTTTN
jgi:hypothetical protein